MLLLIITVILAILSLLIRDIELRTSSLIFALLSLVMWVVYL